MLFFLTLLYVGFYLIRPFEVWGAFTVIPILPVTGIAGLFLLVVSPKYNKDLFKNATDLMMLGFVLAIVLSHVRHGYLAGLTKSFTDFLPALFGYLLVTHGIQSKKQLNIFLLLLTVVACFIATEAVREVTQGVSLFGVEPYYENNTINGVRTVVARVKWLGVFSDPNDLAMLLVVPVPVLLNSVLQKKRISALLVMVLLLVAIFYTNSRGGMLALCSAISFYFILRKKSVKGLVGAGIIIAILMAVGPSRMADISASGDSAHGRIDAWYAGYQMFMGNPFFGVGGGMFTDVNRLTAHNSYVLVMGELGMFGLFFFTGVFFLPFQFCRYHLWGEGRDLLAKDDLFFCSSIYAGLIGIMSAMFFLSRSYVMLPFMVIGLCMACSRIFVSDDSERERLRVIPVKRIFFIMVGVIIAIRVVVKLAI